MSTRLFRLLTALCGILGVTMLITSFIINPGPILSVLVALSFIQGLWWLIAAITILVRAGKAEDALVPQSSMKGSLHAAPTHAQR